MTITTETSRVQYTGNGLTSVWSVPFRFLDQSHLKLIKTDTSGNETTLVLGTDYSVTRRYSNGSVSLTSVLPDQFKLTIIRDVPFTQPVDFTAEGDFSPETHETAFDRMEMQLQQINEVSDRTITQDITASIPGLAFPKPYSSHLIGWDTTGTSLVNIPSENAIAMADLANTTDVSKGDALIGVRQPFAGAVGRTQHQKNIDTVTPYDFGAIGDGITDDTSAINSALAASPNVFLPNGGTFKVSGALYASFPHSSIYGNGKLLFSTITSRITVTSSVLSLSISGITLDGSLYGVHYDDQTAILAVQVDNSTCNIVNVNDCRFVDIYGSGINVSCVAVVTGCYFYNCCGYNNSTGPLIDNYGDAVHVFSARCKGSLISGNYIFANRRGRGGIVTEFNASAITITGNYISGYDRGLHFELCGNICVLGNYVTNTHTAMLISTARVESSGNIFEDGLSTSGPYKFGVIYAYSNYDTSKFTGDTIRVIGTTPAALQLKSASSVLFDHITATGHTNIIGGDGFEFRSSKLDTMTASPAPNNLVLTDCKFSGKIAVLGTHYGLRIQRCNWIFAASSASNVAVQLSGATGLDNISDNTINIAGPLVENYVVDSYLGSNIAGPNYFDNMCVKTDTALSGIFVYNSTPSHQPFYVNRPSFKISSTGVYTGLPFATAYDDSGKRGVERWGTSAPTTGSWIQNDRVMNSNAASGQPIGWVCTVAGSPGTWKAFGTIA